MLRHCVVCLLASGVVALGCAPASRVQVPPRPTKSVDSASCQQASNLRDQAAQVRSAGRVLRARLFEERAHALCNSSPAPVPEGKPQRVRQQLEAVWSWMARTGPRQALSPDRFSDPKMAAALDAVTVGLSRDAKLVVEPVDISKGPTAPTTGWLPMSETSFAKVGEWFERYVVPLPDNDPDTFPIGPFADRIIVYVSKGTGNPKLAVVFDVVEEKAVAEVALASWIGHAVQPLRLDEMHFALPVARDAPNRSGAQGDVAGSSHEHQGVDIWQAWPPKRVATFDAPTAKDVNRCELVVTPQLPNPGKGPPKKNHDDGKYAPTSITAERLRAPTGKDESPQLQQLEDIGHGLFVANWLHMISLIDWKSQVLVGVLPARGNGLVVASPSGRFIAYEAASDAVGLFDRQTGGNRVLLAPALKPVGRPMFSPDEHWLVTGGEWAFGYLWNTVTGRLERTLPSPVPYVRSSLTDDWVYPEGFIRSGKEVVLRQHSPGMRRFEVSSGRELPWPPVDKCHNDSRPSRMAARKDGSIVFLDWESRLYEVGPNGVATVHDCADCGLIDAVSEDGEAFLRSLPRRAQESAEATGDVMQWTASRDGKVLGQWTDDERESHSISHDGHLAISYKGQVRSLTDFRELWPRRGIGELGAKPAVADTTLRFDNGVLLDVRHAKLAATPSQRKPTEYCAKAGEYAVECDSNEIVLYKGTERRASRQGWAKIPALRDDGSELLLETEDELRIWQPESNRERTLRVREFSGYDLKGAAFGPSTMLSLLGTAGYFSDPNQKIVLLIVDELSGRVVFRKDLLVPFSDPTFGTSGRRQVLRAFTGNEGERWKGDVIAWDIKNGDEVERWKDVAAYRPLLHGSLLAFLGPDQVEIARAYPPERLVTVQLLGDTLGALVTSPDGRFEIIGDRTKTAVHLRCRVGHIALPFSACTERLEWPGLLKERLGTAVAATGQ